MNFKTLCIVCIAIIGLNGCGSTVQPSVGTNGAFDDKTLNNNKIDFFTLLRVQNNYGTQSTIVESDRGHK